jgi:hypothetical protein
MFSTLWGTGQHPIVCMPTTRKGLCWWRLFNYLVLGVTNMDHKKCTGKMAKALAEFNFRHLGKHLYGTKRLW